MSDLVQCRPAGDIEAGQVQQDELTQDAGPEIGPRGESGQSPFCPTMRSAIRSLPLDTIRVMYLNFMNPEEAQKAPRTSRTVNNRRNRTIPQTTSPSGHRLAAPEHRFQGKCWC